MEFIDNKSHFMISELKNMEQDTNRPAKRKRIVLSLEVILLKIRNLLRDLIFSFLFRTSWKLLNPSIMACRTI